MIFFGIRASLLAGIITVTLFIIPIMVRSMDEVLKSVPRGLLESALSLGSTKSEVSFSVFLRQCVPGVITAVLLSFGRAIGDAASILFTTGYTDHIPTSLNQPTATLPLAIFFQLSSPIPEVRQRAYAAAVVLVIIILIISILSRVFHQKISKKPDKFLSHGECQNHHQQPQPALRKAAHPEKYQCHDPRKADHGDHGTVGMRQDHPDEEPEPPHRPAC
jgi:ABC-type phosphate transport system permease subunit